MRIVPINEPDQAVLRAALAFLTGRLAERGTIEWALKLRPEDTVKRLAVMDILEAPEGRNLSEPWRSAWRLIEESWNNPAVEPDHGLTAFRIQQRLRDGDRSGALVSAIVSAVAPRLKAEPFSDIHMRFNSLSRAPKHVEQLFFARVVSGRTLDLSVVKLESLTEEDFLVSLATALGAAVERGLDIARRLGWDNQKRPWRLGDLHRVYVVPPSDLAAGEDEPDRFTTGFAPSVKLLHAVVTRLLQVDHAAGLALVRRWKATDSPIHQRLWAAMARNADVAPAEEVAAFLLSRTDEEFWNLHRYPEIAEVRAKRFSEFTPEQQSNLLARIRNRPPRSQWPRTTAADTVAEGRVYWAVRELRRLEMAGVMLPERDKAWLTKNGTQFPDLLQTIRVTEGFLVGPVARWVAPNPDKSYDTITGVARLEVLEQALGSASRGWDDDPAERASAWIRDDGNSRKILDDFEASTNAGNTFPKVWDRFGWAHSPEMMDEAEQHRDVARGFLLLIQLSDETLKSAIEAIAHWCLIWKKQLVAIPGAYGLWPKLWRIAADVTNEAPIASEAEARISAPSIDKEQPLDLDTLNTAAGKLVDVFLAMCPSIEPFEKPFESMPHLRELRDVLVATTGKAGLIARARLLEFVRYFLGADPVWTKEHLLSPLRAETAEALALWRAVAHRTVFHDVLEVVGDVLAERATDLRLDRDTRQMLAFSLVLESLYSYKDARPAVVPNARVQQTIRNLEDEVRAHAADTVRRFVADLSGDVEHGSPSSESLFQAAAAPFLRDVWPLERSLVTPGVSRAFARLPIACGDKFAEAVQAVARFLVPFDCWSMLDYGLYGDDEEGPKMSRIDDQEKAAALLQLLDLTVGTSPGATIPHDLGDALDQVRKVAPQLVEDPTYRRLATTARRA